VLCNIGWIYKKKGNFEIAIQYLRKAEVVALQREGKASTMWLNCKFVIGQIYYHNLKTYSEAEKELEAYMENVKNAEKPNLSRTFQSQFLLAGVYYHTGRHEQCLRLLLKNLKIERDVATRKKSAQKWVREISEREGLSNEIYGLALRVILEYGEG
jgi:tetratricopeptide (TPR) repeat protein